MENIKYVYDKDGIANAVENINGNDFRVRVETLIVNGDKVMINNTGVLNQYGRKYKIPGGGIEPGMTLSESAAKECREEVRVNVTDLRYCCKIENMYKKIPEWHKRILWPLGLKYVGSITYVFVGRWDSKYTGYIKEQDQEAEMLNGCKFYDISEIKNVLCDEHRKVLESII